MKRITTPELVIIEKVGSTFVGFALAVPDVNLAIKELGNGKLLPFGMLRLLWYVKRLLKLQKMRR